MAKPFTMRIVGICSAGHETELFCAYLDPGDDASMAAAIAKVTAAGIVGRCSSCHAPGDRIRTYKDDVSVDDVLREAFYRQKQLEDLKRQLDAS